MSCPAHRKYPLRQPKNYRPPVPRWQLQLPPGVDRVYTIYVGVQQHAADAPTQAAATRAKELILNWIDATRPEAHEAFTVVEGNDEPAGRADVWVCYFTDATAYERSARALALPALYHASIGPGSSSSNNVGLWCERFATAASRLETNYSGLDYLPGLARVGGGATPVEHTYSAYWGAARDRIPDSAHDLFVRCPDDELRTTTVPPSIIPDGRGKRLVGTNYENMVHIRSGQFWEGCGDDEAEAYESVLEPALMTGLRYLWANQAETGTVGLRFVRNADGAQTERKETCAAGFFRSLEDLENWAERHPSHKAIYLGAIKHAKTFGPERKMRTWHEVSVLKAGEARFEYVNCTPNTGVIRFVALDAEDL
ncbi:hypothetical protein BFW01_g6752 [Lasiodiplodia theobromae]|uniref:Phenylacetaldoxime dehydratase family n=1 Tax=Lasiodiplodia theobromae TaxID=45133 RepID=UPI0015C349D8|nr:Phenylacetaldoxime dehydratase family [Lasiodiplodia theobromae]KAF4542395.1 Phenylacetaldoxime dehydratase family [Lasiodiplodia theobromae]KAF9635857.1 hypothetical protein BFW01_g6752 [Lasiodiplodia theobromae]